MTKSKLKLAPADKYAASHPEVYHEMLALHSSSLKLLMELTSVYTRMRCVMADLGRIVEQEMQTRQIPRPPQKKRK